MNVQCETCKWLYDDAECWTICPHGPLWARIDDYCPKCDTVIPIHGKCQHQQSVAIGPDLETGDDDTEDDD